MTRWEYCELRVLFGGIGINKAGAIAMEIWRWTPEEGLKVEKVPEPAKDVTLLRTLSKLGDEGWELVWVDTFAQGGKLPLVYHFYLKRPVAQK